MMAIEPFTLRLSRPLETAQGAIRQRDGFLVRVEYAGEEGVGEATPLPGWTESLSDCRDALERAPTLAREEDWGVALGETNAPAARHGLSLALADARARNRDEPLYRSLGHDAIVHRVPVNATAGDADPGETAARASEAVDAGFECVKVKVGARSVDADVERLQAVREAVGPDVTLRADANGAWDREQAERALGAFEAVGLQYVEQPLPATEVPALAGLRSDSPVPIALDESLSARSVTDILATEAADFLVLKPMAIGGPDRTRQAAVQAQQAGVTPVVSTTIDGVVARTAAVHVAATIAEVPACGLATAEWIAEDMGRDPAPVVDGEMEVPQTAGVGVRPDRR